MNTRPSAEHPCLSGSTNPCATAVHMTLLHVSLSKKKKNNDRNCMRVCVMQRWLCVVHWSWLWWLLLSWSWSVLWLSYGSVAVLCPLLRWSLPIDIFECQDTQQLVDATHTRRRRHDLAPIEVASSRQLRMYTTREDADAQIPVALSTPKEPGAIQRIRHDLTHMPCRSVCFSCVAARGADDSHCKPGGAFQELSAISCS